MALILWLTTVLLVINAAQSYILLTANVDDVQAITKQLLAAPMVDQISKIWRRAAMQFNHHLKSPKIQKRVDDDSDKDGSANSEDYRRHSRRVLDSISEFGKDAAKYFKSLRRSFNQYIKE